MTPEEFKSLIHSTITEISYDLQSKREAQIRHILESFGFNFFGSHDLCKFIKERCNPTLFPNNKYQLTLPNKVVLQWCDNVVLHDVNNYHVEMSGVKIINPK